ncbi:MAG: serine hydrolase [Bacteroidetes bacterium]|nr:serine hydrolase [Bacteroidota bacterium]
MANSIKISARIIGLMSLGFTLGCQPQNPLSIAIQEAEPIVKKVLEEPKRYEVQIRYTEISRTVEGSLQFNSHNLYEDSNVYFYPASTVKLPVAILAMQKVRELQEAGLSITADTPFEVYTEDHRAVATIDTTKSDQKLTIHHLIKKIFLVSDNEAYNLLFDFLGRDYINQNLKRIGLNQTTIHHKFLAGADNNRTWEYVFLSQGDTLYYQPSNSSVTIYSNKGLKGLFKGSGHQNGDEIINDPFDFSQKNRVSLSDLEGILTRVLFPEHYSSKQRFSVNTEDYEFLRYWMSRTTLESDDPNYKGDIRYWDSYVKFFIYGDQKGQMNPEIRSYNKVGDAYGTLTETAYIKSEKDSIEFLLTATILSNENGIFNDDNYEYETIGFPFMAGLGRAILAYEKNKSNP